MEACQRALHDHTLYVYQSKKGARQWVTMFAVAHGQAQETIKPNPELERAG
jgi:hypothetical protein